jgi:hypothetical protein
MGGLHMLLPEASFLKTPPEEAPSRASKRYWALDAGDSRRDYALAIETIGYLRRATRMARRRAIHHIRPKGRSTLFLPLSSRPIRTSTSNTSTGHTRIAMSSDTMPLTLSSLSKIVARRGD